MIKYDNLHTFYTENKTLFILSLYIISHINTRNREMNRKKYADYGLLHFADNTQKNFSRLDNLVNIVVS
jgi:hypothetical protein